MNENLIDLVDVVRNRTFKDQRQTAAPNLIAECEAEKLSWMKRMSRRTIRMCEAETPIILPGESFAYTRSIPGVSKIYSTEEWAEVTKGLTVHARDPINNITPDWGTIIDQGMLERKRIALESKERLKDDPKAVEFLDAAIETIDATINLASKYAAKAREIGRNDLAEMLEQVPAKPARSFQEALQSFKILYAVTWLSGFFHIGIGRFDQFMWPYLEADLNSGKLTEEKAEALVTEFFLSFNKDSDFIGGLSGDNGQTMMLGGVKRDGTDGVNKLTYMALRASCEVGMIDPKINLRITKDTDLELLTLASELTRKGLGFPQYSNDDIVIPNLVAHGYDIEDARDYSVAACWEFVIPGKGMEVVNIAGLNFPASVDKAIREGLAAGDDFDAIMARAEKNIHDQLFGLLKPSHGISLPPAPYFSVVMGDCLERGKNLGEGLKYNNFGVHGACSANAADALAAVKKFVFETKTVTPDELLKALEANFAGYDELQKQLIEDGPKVGNNDDYADGILVKLFGYFADACEAYGDNGRGGIIRPGTGSAMMYVTLADTVGATADGRKAGEYFSTNLAPSPLARLRGPISMLQSYSKLPYDRCWNGGPITMELSDSVFRDEESVRKVAMLIRTFAQLGCEQLQLNVLNGEKLIEAKAHPEEHKNLIVRVWGWSGYFVELPPEYQDQVIKRHLLTADA